MAIKTTVRGVPLVIRCLKQERYFQDKNKSSSRHGLCTPQRHMDERGLLHLGNTWKSTGVSIVLQQVYSGKSPR